MQKPYGLPELQRDNPAAFEMMAERRKLLMEIEMATQRDLDEMRARDYPREALDERYRLGKFEGAAIRQELDSLTRMITDILACCPPALIDFSASHFSEQSVLTPDAPAQI